MSVRDFDPNVNYGDYRWEAYTYYNANTYPQIICTGDFSYNLPPVQVIPLSHGLVGRCKYCGVKYTDEERLCIACGAPL